MKGWKRMMVTRKRATEHGAAESIATVPSLEQSKGWDKLSTEEQAFLKTESTEVLNGLKIEAQSKLSIGEHLTRIQDILGPKRLFVSFVDHNFGMSRATAYRYIDQFKVGKKLLPQPILEVAVARGTRITEDVIRQLPPPNTTNTEVIRQYLENVERQPHPIASRINEDYDSLLKECLNFVVLRESRVPGNQRDKNNWHDDLIGMLLTKWGIATPKQFRPIAVPETMVATRGRPKQQIQQAA
jgi:hypothetical protein